MARVYADMIKAKKINPKTQEVWKIEDVPARYQEEVRRILEEEASL